MAATGTTPVARIKAPKPNTEFRVHNGRLALFHEAPDAKEYWSDYWTEADQEHQRRSAVTEGLGPIERFANLIPKDRPVLDAGCGTGNHVWAMNQRGFDAWGIDYAPRVVERAQELFPGIRYEVGDAHDLPAPDRSQGTYVSLGIVEHFEQGPLDSLKEARRVVADDGLAIIEVPFLNHHRARQLAELRKHPQQPTDRTFHQYYFSTEEMTSLLEQAGFRLVDRRHHHAIGFLRREHKLFSAAMKSRFLPDRVRPALFKATQDMPQVLGDRYAHMMVFVARPQP